MVPRDIATVGTGQSGEQADIAMLRYPFDLLRIQTKFACTFLRPVHKTLFFLLHIDDYFININRYLSVFTDYATDIRIHAKAVSLFLFWSSLFVPK